MRKIEIREEKEKKEVKKKTIVGVVLVLLLALSTAGYAFFSKERTSREEKVSYAGIDFFEVGGFWKANIQDKEFVFRFLPSETENISALIFWNLQNYLNQPLYLASESKDANNEISRNMYYFVAGIRDACLQDCGEELPVKNCSSDNVIVIKISNSTKISQEENCVFIESENEEVIRASDAFIYKIFGINQ